MLLWITTAAVHAGQHVGMVRSRSDSDKNVANLQRL